MFRDLITELILITLRCDNFDLCQIERANAAVIPATKIDFRENLNSTRALFEIDLLYA